LPAASSRSAFEGAAYAGDVVALEQPTPGAEQYRVFQQAATGFVSVQSVREGAEEAASNFCARKGKIFRGVFETASKPPHILGNFPRVEVIFECADKPSTMTAPAPALGKYDRLGTLKKLLDSGAITPAEFEREKAKVLAEP
jgi:hypothetical protein